MSTSACGLWDIDKWFDKVTKWITPAVQHQTCRLRCLISFTNPQFCNITNLNPVPDFWSVLIRHLISPYRPRSKNSPSQHFQQVIILITWSLLFATDVSLVFLSLTVLVIFQVIDDFLADLKLVACLTALLLFLSDKLIKVYNTAVTVSDKT